jgi:predicted lipoprotein with Yx(FWY)xxD motif
MRFRIAAVGAVLSALLSLALSCLFSPAAFAQPANVAPVDGYLVAEGQPLFIYTGTADVPQLCDEGGGCAKGGSFTPFPAWGRPPDEGVWTVVDIGAHGRQWAYRGSPLYTRNGEWTDAVAKEQVNWRKAPAIEATEGSPIPVLDAKDPSITVQPARLKGDPPKYPSASLRQREQGSTTSSMCIDAEGRPQYLATAVSTGFARLDAATRNWFWRYVRFTPAQVGEKPVMICNFTFSFDWKIP